MTEPTPDPHAEGSSVSDGAAAPAAEAGEKTEARTRAGYVALVGRPNAGKSTLLNQLIGEHLSIVTPMAQTTWQRVTGLLTVGDDQLIFLDGQLGVQGRALIT